MGIILAEEQIYLFGHRHYHANIPGYLSGLTKEWVYFCFRKSQTLLYSYLTFISKLDVLINNLYLRKWSQFSTKKLLIIRKVIDG